MDGLDSRYVLAFTFEQYFVDKDTGFPLAGGYIKFFEDTQRTVPKNVYTLSGNPSLGYTYTNLGPKVNLNSVGVPEDTNGNNIPIYFFPYVGNPSGKSTIVDLYYYAVFSSGDVEQFTRSAQPNVFQGSTTETVNNNYLPNGQFWLHNDVPATAANTYKAGQITGAITVIAPGGWTFERASDSTAKDNVSFSPLSVVSISPPDVPRYQLEVKCTDTGNLSGNKDVCVKLGGVNKFASATQTYTWIFWAKSNSGSDITVDTILRKDYGTGGSVTSEANIGPGSITVTPSGALFNIQFAFGTNTGKNINTDNNDDFLQLILRIPGSNTFDVFYTDFGLFFNPDNNIISNPSFPGTTDRQFVYQSVFQDFNIKSPTTHNVDYTPNLGLTGLPAYDGSNFYLPMVMTPNGIAFDNSWIGNKVDETNLLNYDTSVTGLHKYTNRMLAWGFQYETVGYSPIGIPFSRVQQYWWDSTVNIPIYGTGPNYFTALIPNSDNVMLFTNNSLGGVTNAADHGTTFTISTIHKPTATYYTRAYLLDPIGFWLENLNAGDVVSSTAGTSGFTVSVVQEGNSLIPHITGITTALIADNPGNPGKYFTFESYHSGGLLFYVWYQVSTETDPVPPGAGTGIKVKIEAGETAAVIAQKTRQALNGWQETLVSTVAASAITPGTYFTMSSAGIGQAYYIWYKKAGIGPDPAPGGIGIEVDLPLGTETAAQVATATQIAVNSKYFASPDWRGLFVRNWDNSTGIDKGLRWTTVPGFIGTVFGTEELSSNLSHIHRWGQETSANGGVGAAVIKSFDPGDVENNSPTSDMVNVNGQNAEARPVNAVVNYAILY